MNCLVIGGTGFVGSHLVRRLLNEGVEVITLSRSGDPSKIIDVKEKVKIERGSITEINEIMDVVKKYDVQYMVYVAAERPPWTPSSVVKTMIEGFLNVLETARLMDIKRLVWASSYSQLGPPNLYSQSRVDEEAPLRPKVGHGISYVVNEFNTQFYRETYGLDILGLRLGLVFGPGRDRLGFMDILVSLFEDAVLGKKVVVSKGDTRIVPQYVKEAANVLWFGLNVKRYEHCIFNTCDEAVSLRDLANYVKEQLPNAQIEVQPGDETPRVLVDASRIRKELNYKPKYTVKDGVADYVNYLKNTVKK
ncbi:MAG: NAD(P)-dependent oxidoreductase [Candidatus Bathyarchaeia archaeon]